MAKLAVAALGGLALASATYEQIEARRDAARFPAPGRMVPIGDGRSLHAMPMGEGGPTVVVETGAGSSALAWDGIQRRLAEETTVVTYDRAGYGWSRPGPFPLTAGRVVDDLHGLVHGLRLPEPLILVGHSLGGIYVRAYARRHPEEVGGLVLVDSSHEGQNERMTSAIGPSRRLKMFLPMVVMLAPPRGALRVARRAGALEQAIEGLTKTVPPEHREAAAAHALSASYRRTIVGEMASFMGAPLEPTLPAGLGRMPIVVMTAGKAARDGASEAEQKLAESMRPVWLELQAEIAAMSSDSRVVMAEGATHNIHDDDPDLVVEEIRRAVVAVRAGRPVGAVSS